MALKLYQFENCPYCTKVRGVLGEKGLEYEKIEVPLDRDDRTELLDISGQIMVPVLVDGETVINDSEKILDYLSEKY
jgi:glutathione S-transferase